MISNLPALLFMIPFFSAVSMPLIGLFGPNGCWAASVASLSAMSLTAAAALILVRSEGPVSYTFGGWPPPFGVEWLMDGLSVMLLATIALIGLTALLYSGPGIRRDYREKTVSVYTLAMLLISGLTGLVLAADLFNLFVFLEVASLSSYALVAAAGGRALLSSFRYLLLGTIGASFYLLGVGYLYAATGTLNTADLTRQIPDLLESRAVLSGLVFILVGLGIKMALVPLHGWLPGAYGRAAGPIGPLVVSLMTKVAIYAFVRITFWVFGVEAVLTRIPFMQYLVWIGALATIVGILLALTEQNLARMFAYGGISHVGLTVMGLTLGNATGYTGGVFYLINDALMQAGLFMVAGTLSFRYGVRTVDDLGRVRGPIPWTAATLMVTALSMIGIPPTGGFFGKWYILLGAIEARNFLAAGVLILGTVLTLAAFGRIFQKLFMEPQEARPGELHPPLPLEFRLGMGAVMAGILLMGFFSDAAVHMIGTMASPPGF